MDSRFLSILQILIFSQMLRVLVMTLHSQITMAISWTMKLKSTKIQLVIWLHGLMSPVFLQLLILYYTCITVTQLVVARRTLKKPGIVIIWWFNILVKQVVLIMIVLAITMMLLLRMDLIRMLMVRWMVQIVMMILMISYWYQVVLQIYLIIEVLGRMRHGCIQLRKTVTSSDIYRNLPLYL